MKSFVLAAAFLASVANAITFTTPTDVHSASPVTISWTQDSSDPSTWSLYLVNEAFHNSFAIFNPVNGSAGSVNLTLPTVPIGDGYTLEATQIGNITAVIGTSSTFSVAAPVSSTSSSATSTTASASGSTVPVASTALLSSTSVSGSSPSTSVSSGSSVPVSGSSSSAPSPSAFGGSGSGAMSMTSSVSSWLAAFLAVAAGGAIAL
ncbi:hypothetical protein BC835DRAFT_162430 [Cytidiella melzeri]|nr:hypothetical protein BC835DRAFT_162430 [Cytidiella melzeri]